MLFPFEESFANDAVNVELDDHLVSFQPQSARHIHTLRTCFDALFLQLVYRFRVANIINNIL